MLLPESLRATKLEVRATYEHTDGCHNLQELSYRKKTARCSMCFPMPNDSFIVFLHQVPKSQGRWPS